MFTKATLNTILEDSRLDIQLPSIEYTCYDVYCNFSIICCLPYKEVKLAIMCNMKSSVRLLK